ncbi:DUF397 domain-containing protein [Streptomyces halstedii]|uniref:DUF397 domain-containing protein n=1 Tax=Streptomyces TaxID=1883 RepID=UPI0004A9809A|nr:DUF397 domain-containing protein [Streptomyces sp. NTK 937]KDQ70473.1 hypothetical protein DT87_25720 [Streptomyces sp. NTK 937]WSX35106.1 DUF397 domain-containing protein [Streptomyces halstedii]
MNTEALAGTPPETVWFKSSYSSGAAGGDCLEVAAQSEAVLVRDSKNPTGPMLTLTQRGWSAFVAYAAGN